MSYPWLLIYVRKHKRPNHHLCVVNYCLVFSSTFILYNVGTENSYTFYQNFDLIGLFWFIVHWNITVRAVMSILFYYTWEMFDGEVRSRSLFNYGCLDDSIFYWIDMLGYREFAQQKSSNKVINAKHICIQHVTQIKRL